MHESVAMRRQRRGRPRARVIAGGLACRIAPPMPLLANGPLPRTTVTHRAGATPTVSRSRLAAGPSGRAFALFRQVRAARTAAATSAAVSRLSFCSNLSPRRSPSSTVMQFVLQRCAFHGGQFERRDIRVIALWSRPQFLRTRGRFGTFAKAPVSEGCFC